MSFDPTWWAGCMAGAGFGLFIGFVLGAFFLDRLITDHGSDDGGKGTHGKT